MSSNSNNNSNDNPIPGLDEDTIFTILSHPLRRKILTAIYQNKSITFSEMSDVWKIKTGTLYFHLKELDQVITQNQAKHYILTSTGIKLCQWFIGGDDGQAKVNKIDAFSRIASPIFLKFDNSISFQILLYLISIVSIFSSSLIDTLLLGPMPIPIPNDINFVFSVSLNFGIVVFQFGFLIALIKLFGNPDPKVSLRALLVSNSFIYFFTILLLILFYLPSIAISPFSLGTFSWFFISSISQIFFILVLTGSLMIGHGIEPERALLVAVILLYITISIGLIFGLF